MEFIPPPPTLPPGAYVFAYLRDSGGDGQEKSVRQQEDVIRAFCERYNLVLTRIFADAARSGGSVEKRAQFLAMMDATQAQDPRPAGLLVWNLARFSRDVDDSDYYKSTLRKRGIVIHSLTDQIPAGTFGPVVEKLIDVANQEYRRQNSAAVKRALRDLVRAGYAPGGHLPPKGYLPVKVTTGTKRDGKERTAIRWEVDPEIGPLITLAFQLRAEGKSYSEITKATGGLYRSVNSWLCVFRNRSYLGVGKCGDEEFPTLDDGSPHHPALVDPQTFEAVQALYKLRPRAGLDHPRRIAYPTLLSGLAYCLECGGAMVFHRGSGTKDWPCYICARRDRTKGARECNSRRIGARNVDRVILDYVLETILTPAFVEELLEEARLKLADTESVSRTIEAKREDLRMANQSMQNLLYLVEKFGAGAAEDRYQKRAAEITRLKFEIGELENQQRALDVEVTPEALALVLDEWRTQIAQTRDAGDLAALRALIARFVPRVGMSYDIIRLHLAFSVDNFTQAPSDNITPRGGTAFTGCKVVEISWRI